MVGTKCKEDSSKVMKRVPEPELMQDLCQVKAYAKADFSENDDSLIKRLEEYLLLQGKKLDSNSLVIDMGCGPGNITERLSCRWPAVKIIGIDGSESMLAVARDRKNENRGRDVLANIKYFCCDIGSIANESMNLEKSPDLIISNSLIHHFHDPSCFWKALKLLSIKGTVHLHRDLRRPSSYKKAIALQRLYLSDSPQVLIEDYLASLQAAFNVGEIKDQLEREGLDHFTVCENQDRYLEVVGIF